MSTQPAIEVDRLSVSFEGRAVIEGLSLRVDSGEKVLLMGPSGSGKSTVLMCVMGFVQPQAGEVRVEGQVLTRQSIWQLRERMVWVAQEPDLGAGTVREALEEPFGYRANARLRDNLQRVPELMARFGLGAVLLDKEIATLSGGEKQRIALVSALLLDRRIILLDEISSALDAQSKQAVMAFLRQERDLTVLCVSHDAEWTGAVDRVVRIEAQEARV